MIFYNCLRLACHTVIQVFKILFYCLISFVLIFGCMFAFANTHFSILVHCKFFDYLWQIVNGLFIDPNVSTIVTGVRSLGDSISDYASTLSQKGFGVEIVLGIILLLSLFVIIYWYRFAVNRDLYNVTTATSSRGSIKDIWKQPSKSISQVLVSFLFTGIYDTVAIFGMYHFCSFILSFNMNTYLTYFIFMLLAIVLFGIRAILFNGWEYRQLIADESTFNSLSNGIRQKLKNIYSIAYNSMLLVLFNWTILLAFGQILVGYLLVLAIAIVYHTSKCFGVTTYYYCSKESFYINKKTQIKFREINNK